MGHAGSSNTRILVVDDDAGVRQVLRGMIESAGYPVELASNGKEALDKLQQESFNLIITDLVMPELEGIETIQVLRKNYPHIRIIAMSGAFGGEYLGIAGFLGAHKTLTKPVRIDTVLATIREALAEETK